MKRQIKLKELKSFGYPIYKVPYCSMQTALKYYEPYGFYANGEGWRFDIYFVKGVNITTGYGAIGQALVGHEKAENKCKEIQGRQLGGEDLELKLFDQVLEDLIAAQ